MSGNVAVFGIGRPLASKLPCHPESILMYWKPCACSLEEARASDSALTLAWVRKPELMVCSLKVLQPRYGRCPVPFTCAEADTTASRGMAKAPVSSFRAKPFRRQLDGVAL